MVGCSYRYRYCLFAWIGGIGTCVYAYIVIAVACIMYIFLTISLLCNNKFKLAAVYIEGSMDGELTLRIDGDGASIRTFYGKLIPRFEDLEEDDESSGDDESDDGEQENDGTSSSSSARKRRRKTKKTKTCTLKVDSRKLSACLQWQGTMLLGRSVGSAVLCMVKNEMLCLHCMLNPGTVGFFTYYVPVHYLSPDQMDF